MFIQMTDIKRVKDVIICEQHEYLVHKIHNSFALQKS